MTKQGLLEIERISADQTVDIRHVVLWPEKAKPDVVLPEDADGTHFGASINGALVAVISLFETPEGIRFRKFATLPEWQDKGVGTQLLTHAIQWSRKKGERRIWCDARVSALPFYARHGFAAQGGVFEKSGVAYTVMSREL
ncbi:GNAT family N-acetyltransferase [Rhizobium rhizoryzae]|uniref:GNAT superfamily N-acetyltransferase n=1 Tax=Rhizobium rhizoryzae TaxID=451876 RepID=A0A7W6LIL7_9HYPH|nr:GNAT family N-acetyltransferase [Rhizobium rhizoryzae]MBB4145044.1 GNAT superfamily N-acetyltransferase [Rhizobium rhizoryzae]